MSHTNFLGIPVEGDIDKPDRTEQRPLSELEPLLRAVIDDPTIHSFGWRQYTPYFNDGDPCKFGVHEAWFLTVDDVANPDFSDDFDEEDYWPGYDHPTLGGRGSDWVNGRRVTKPYVGPDEARYDRAVALAEAITGGAFEDVLLDAFGDHARITVKATGITVETYEHD